MRSTVIRYESQRSWRCGDLGTAVGPNGQRNDTDDRDRGVNIVRASTKAAIRGGLYRGADVTAISSSRLTRSNSELDGTLPASTWQGSNSRRQAGRNRYVKITTTPSTFVGSGLSSGDQGPQRRRQGHHDRQDCAGWAQLVSGRSTGGPMQYLASSPRRGDHRHPRGNSRS